MSKWTNVSDIDLMNTTDFLDTTIDPPIFPVYSQSIETAPVYLFCCALSLAATSSFLRAGFVLKFLAMLTCIAIQGSVLLMSQLYIVYDTGRIRFVENVEQKPFTICFIIHID